MKPQPHTWVGVKGMEFCSHCGEAKSNAADKQPCRPNSWLASKLPEPQRARQ